MHTQRKRAPRTSARIGKDTPVAMSVQVLGLPPQLATLKRCVVMGVLNVTPDSFSDGGQFFSPEQAIAQGLRLVSQGADIVDVGGESTRPGAQRVSEQQELDRVLPVITSLAQQGVLVSVDTTRAAVAQAAVHCGAVLVNDISAGAADEQMPALLAQLPVPVVAMHRRGDSQDMDARATYTDVVAQVVQQLQQRMHVLQQAGVDQRRIILDPGLGFAKNPEHNWALLAHLDELHTLGRPLLIGASRKRFLADIVAGRGQSEHLPQQRDAATAALTAWVAGHGAWGVRVHEPSANADAVRVVHALHRASIQHVPSVAVGVLTT